jgi:chromosome segregation ATPase
MGKIDDAVDKLTEKEKEEFKDLIDECLQREKEIEENRKISQEALSELQKDIDGFCNSFNNFNLELINLQKELSILKTQLKNPSTGELN